jgi:PucR C-terminal helix-turn-helix domain/GGDEF-like domain
VTAVPPSTARDRVAALCAELQRDQAPLVREVVEAIRRELPEYAELGVDELVPGVTGQFRGLLGGLAQGRPPTEHDRAVAAELGRSRARQGLPAQAMISAHHVGYREVWNQLLTRAGHADGATATDLLPLIGTVWSWMQEFSSAAAVAHHDQVRADDAAEIGVTYRFLSALHHPSADWAEETRLARALGFDPAGWFQAVCAPAEPWDDDLLDVLRRRLRRGPGAVRSIVRGTHVVLLGQNVDAQSVVRAVADTAPSSTIGVGLVRRGLAGAADTVLDAAEALAVAPGAGAVATFGRDWLLATLTPRAQRLDPLLAQGQEVAAAHPGLAATVRAFADNGLSWSAAGRELLLHPNTVKYRLERWEQLTGWNVRSWPGLAASMLALGLPASSSAPSDLPGA